MRKPSASPANCLLIAVNHVEGTFTRCCFNIRKWPSLPSHLVVSGGHTHLFEIAEPGKYRLLGKTRDDAAGEAYDKVASFSVSAIPAARSLTSWLLMAIRAALNLRFAKMKGNQLDFSFSGIKTAVLRWTEANDVTG